MPAANRTAAADSVQKYFLGRHRRAKYTIDESLLAAAIRRRPCPAGKSLSIVARFLAGKLATKDSTVRAAVASEPISRTMGASNCRVR
eukprot:3738109-Pyramimonas_sp.AAC.1